MPVAADDDRLGAVRRTVAVAVGRLDADEHGGAVERPLVPATGSSRTCSPASGFSSVYAPSPLTSSTTLPGSPLLRMRMPRASAHPTYIAASSWDELLARFRVVRMARANRDRGVACVAGFESGQSGGEDVEPPGEQLHELPRVRLAA